MAESDPHPIDHVDPDKCYEWLRADCAALDAARQAREDGLVGAVTQISSAALLAIPGVVYAASGGFPKFEDAKLLYIGMFLFVAALYLSMLEQYMSGVAYGRQKVIVQNYYLKESKQREDTKFVNWVRRVRHTAYVAFASSVCVSAYALTGLENHSDGKPTSTSTSTSTTAATATTTATAASSVAKSGRLHEEIRPAINSASAAKAVNH